MKTVTLEDKVDFLKQVATYGVCASEVSVRETHASWVFLAGDRVYKMKKPIKLPALDFRELETRERNCREELRLNRRLAGDVYLSVIPLVQRPDGSLGLGGEGSAIEWLVVMRRLPDDRMLNVLLQNHGPTREQLDRLAEVLASFYRKAERPAVSPRDVVDGFLNEQAINREILLSGRFDIDDSMMRPVVDAVDRQLEGSIDDLAMRVTKGRYLEGHGDLRPEHICFTDPLVIFDCLEFSRRLRIVDPFDEIAFLEIECCYLGADWIGPVVRQRLAELMQDDVPESLYRCYAAFRALLRARMALGHLHFGSSSDLGKWLGKTRQYAALAARYAGPAKSV